MNILLFLSFWACTEKNTDGPPSDSGIVVGPPPEPEDSATNEDTGLEDTGLEDTGLEDTAIADSGVEEDTAVTDTGITEDTSVQTVLMPDFSLPDVNPYSATLGNTISVRDQMESISGWYFIKAT